MYKYKISRRDFIKHSSALAGVGLISSYGSNSVFSATKVTLVNSIRSLANPYHATWNLGGRIFAESIGANYVTLITEGNSEKGIPPNATIPPEPPIASINACAVFSP